MQTENIFSIWKCCIIFWYGRWHLLSAFMCALVIIASNHFYWRMFPNFFCCVRAFDITERNQNLSFVCQSKSTEFHCDLCCSLFSLSLSVNEKSEITISMWFLVGQLAQAIRTLFDWSMLGRVAHTSTRLTTIEISRWNMKPKWFQLLRFVIESRIVHVNSQNNGTSQSASDTSECTGVMGDWRTQFHQCR